ncbi:MAG: EamA family transporter [Acidimicrobiales bacterium]|jgi:drug/metabolite transporter (DMT)-like permease
MAALLAVLSSLAWGTSDFMGGVTARKANAWTVVIIAQFVGLFAALALAPMFGGQLTWEATGWGIIAGISGALGLVALYHGLATGRMATVAPVAALVGAAIPVVVGVVDGERPSNLTWIGIAIALPAIWLVAREESGNLRNGLTIAVAAGAGFGFFFVFIASAPDSANLWPLVPARMGAVPVVLATALVTKQVTSNDFVFRRPVYLGAALAGGGDMVANMLFLAAVQRGLLSVVSVLASLYPAVTVVLARLNGEPVKRTQWAGMGLSLVAVAFIAL